VLGSLLGIPGFDFASIDDVRASLPMREADVTRRLNVATQVELAAPGTTANGLERVADVPIHFADPLARRAPALQRTADAAAPRARMNARTMQQLGVAAGGTLRIVQGAGEAALPAAIDEAVPDSVVRIAAAHPSTCTLAGLSGPVEARPA